MRKLVIIVLVLLLTIPTIGTQLVFADDIVCEEIAGSDLLDTSTITFEDLVITSETVIDPVTLLETTTYTATYSPEATGSDNFGFVYAAGRVYLREGDSASVGDPEGLMEIGAPLQVCGETVDEDGNTWYYVKILDDSYGDLVPGSDGEGWMSADFFEPIAVDLGTGDIAFEIPDAWIDPITMTVDPLFEDQVLSEVVALLDTALVGVTAEDVADAVVEGVEASDTLNDDLIGAADNNGRFFEGETNQFNCQGRGNSCNTAAAEHSNSQGYVGDVNKFGCVGRGNSCNASGQSNDGGGEEASESSSSSNNGNGKANGKNK